MPDPTPTPAPTPYLPDAPSFLPVPFKGGVYLCPPDAEPHHPDKPKTHRVTDFRKLAMSGRSLPPRRFK